GSEVQAGVDKLAGGVHRDRVGVQVGRSGGYPSVASIAASENAGARGPGIHEVRILRIDRQREHGARSDSGTRLSPTHTSIVAAEQAVGGGRIESFREARVNRDGVHGDGSCAASQPDVAELPGRAAAGST